MCNPAALVALMHDSDYDVLKEAFYYAWAKHISETLADDENNGNVINDYYMGANILNSERLAQKLVASYSVPGTKEEYYKNLYRSVSGHDYVQLLIEIDGDTISLEYPVESDLTSHTLVIEEALRTFVAKKRPSKKQKVENFLAKHNVEFATRIPVKYIREIYTPDMKNVLWKNPKFEGLTK